MREQQEASKSQEERQRMLEEHLETERAERKALAEKLAKVQKQLQSTDVDGGEEAMVLERPEASSSSTSVVSYAEFYALKQQVTTTTQMTEETAERVDVMSKTVYDLQDGKKVDRSKVSAKHIPMPEISLLWK